MSTPEKSTFYFVAGPHCVGHCFALLPFFFIHARKGLLSVGIVFLSNRIKLLDSIFFKDIFHFPFGLGD